MEYRKRQPQNLAPPQRLGRWLRLKQYQIEVTFGVYMFTPVEKFVFWSVVFLLFGLFAIACILYLPQHVVFMVNRAWFYVNGGDILTSTSSASSGTGSNVLAANHKDGISLTAAATQTLESVVRDL
ncbi:hypothetical protein SLS62_008141 [Diatrype stigma]|uniref:Uncharacterized protein n=1 Tax=Diatrype stigma TaxID=117547 RepID=A0AAN9UM33_9PEZI